MSAQVGKQLVPVTIFLDSKDRVEVGGFCMPCIRVVLMAEAHHQQNMAHTKNRALNGTRKNTTPPPQQRPGVDYSFGPYTLQHVLINLKDSHSAIVDLARKIVDHAELPKSHDVQIVKQAEKQLETFKERKDAVEGVVTIEVSTHACSPLHTMIAQHTCENRSKHAALLCTDPGTVCPPAPLPHTHMHRSKRRGSI